MQLGLGPVFAAEWLTTARNWRVYVMRVLFGLILLGILALVAMDSGSARQASSSISEQAEAGRIFAATIVATQLTLMLLIAPAATAGSLCMDKARGTLAHVMTTDLTSGEIILGKLAARLLPSLGLILSTLGLTAITTLMGGIDPRALTGAAFVTVGVTVLGASLALAISVWAGKTHEVVMACYLILIAWLAFYPFWQLLSIMPGSGLSISRPPDWIECAHPFYTLLNVKPGEFPIGRQVGFLLGCLAISTALIGVAIARLRPVAIRQMNRPAGAKKVRRWFRRASATASGEVARPGRRWKLWPGPSLDGNPVLWREWHRTRPSKWIRAIWWIYMLASIGCTALAIVMIVTTPSRGGPAAEVSLILINGFQVVLGLLLVSVSAATSLADERTRGSLDVLLTTSLSTRSIVWGKWWGAFRVVPSLMVLPCVLAVVALIFSDRSIGPRPPGWSPDWTSYFGPVLMGGLILAYGATIVSVGLVAATWIHRQDRAVMATVAYYVLASLAWPIAMAIILKHDNIHGPGMACGSPFMGIAYTGSTMIERYRTVEDRWGAQIAWATFWILTNLTISALLLKLELSRFNKKFGRTPEEGMTQSAVPDVLLKIMFARVNRRFGFVKKLVRGGRR